MANIITGKVWSLDTVAGPVTQSQVIIHSIRVRFTTAGAGSCIITSSKPDVTTGQNATQEVLLDLKTTAASTAAAYMLDQQFTFGDQTFQGLTKLVSVNVDTIYVVTCPAR
jgi:hypothetical protein